ncbi:MAG: TetR/AcrR family transcriptional regulator [Acidobacteria bacterium]|nr:TetR/AcrR family transcriptional regulator [Acidobacteriota bacterium]
MTPKHELEKPNVARMAAEDRRQQIIEVAVRLFSQKGFRGTTTKEIALAAGVNEAIIFRHFATKRELYTAIMDRKACSVEIQAIQQGLDEAMQAKDDHRVFTHLAFHLLEFHEHDDTAIRLLLYSALEKHELAEMIFRNHISRKHRQLADYVKQRIADGAFRRVNPLLAVRGFMGMLINQVMHRKFFDFDGHDTVPQNNRHLAEKYAEMFLAGIRQTAEPKR